MQADGQLLISFLFHAALFTAKEAVVGFVIGSIFGFALGAAIARFRMLQRGLMPYVVASQTIPILAIAPIVVVGLGSVSIAGWTPSGLAPRLGHRRLSHVLPGHGEHGAWARVGRPEGRRADALVRVG